MKYLVAFLFLLAVITCSAEPRDSLVPFLKWTDNNGTHINAHSGSIIMHKGIYYWHGEYKLPGKSELGFGSKEQQGADGGVRCYSSKDLYNWKDEGVVLSVDFDDPKSDIAYGCTLERPKVIYNEKNKNFVMFFKLFLRGAGYSVCHTGVAVGDSPTGPFKYSHKFLAANSELGAGDFAIYKDDDGSVYHFCSQKSKTKPNHLLFRAKLADDYLRPNGPYEQVEGIRHGTEAPTIFKRNGKYYLLGSGCTYWNPNKARSAVADSITGPWTRLGNPCTGTNQHNDLAENKTFGGQSTFVYHVPGTDNYIAMFDVWRPENPIESTYIWLPVTFEGDKFTIKWHDEWKLKY